MNKQFVFIKIFFFLIFSSLIFDIEKVYSYSCLPYTCSSIGGRCTDSVTLPSGWCYEADMLYSCGGTDRNCTGGYDGTTCGGEPTHCPCCDTSSLACDDCTPETPVCPANTTTSNTGDLWEKLEICCDNGPGCDDNCNSKNCYCYICTLPDCDPLKNDDLGWGDYPQYKSCQNTPIDGNCSTRYRTCYCEEPPALPACPSPLLESNPVGAPNMILPNFKYTFNICDVYKYGDCYEPVSSQPVETLVIDNDPANGYGFLSNTHTGIPKLTTNSGNLNEPVKMIASYTDINGANDIEALGVWFRDQSLTGEVNTPIWISTTAAPDAPANNSWGFMMVKEGGIWVPYVPSWAVDPAVWTKAMYDDINRSFMIPGPNRGNMVEVRITSPISPISPLGNTVTMEFSLRFSDPSILTESVSQTTYDVLLMGLDTFSFTPYNNYTFPVSENWRTTVQDNPATPEVDYWEVNKLRYRALPLESQTYARDWAFSNVTAGWMGNKWTIDKIAPTIQFINNTPSASSVIGNTIRIEWQATDEKSLYSIVGNIYSTISQKDISIVEASSGIKYTNPIVPTLSSSTGTVVGNLDTGWTFKVDPNINSNSHTGSITIYIGENREGILIFYLTAFDDAGNIAMPQYDQSIFDINDWLVTDGGLMYSLGGSTFITKQFTEDPGWTGILPPFGTSVNESLVYNKADISSELFAQGPSITNSSPDSLVNSSLTGSYNIKNYPPTKVKGYYENFSKAYERNRNKIDANKLAEEVITSPLNGKNGLNSACKGNKEYCVLTSTGNLEINTLPNSEFTCNRKVAVFVNGNLTINPPILNGASVADISNETGCIFIVSGDVLIAEGSDAATNYNFAYDVINAYILADGEVIIDHENSKIPEDRNVIDNADNVGLWTSSDPSNTNLSQENNLLMEGTGSIKVTAADNYTSSSEVIDLMEYSTDALAQAAYYTGVSAGVVATGGIMTTVGSDVVHTFNAFGRLTVTRGGNVEVLVVGGGGGGGGDDCGSGGGGGGGVIYNPSFAVSPGLINASVGLGGISTVSGQTSGQNSSFSTIIARGGGYGGGHHIGIDSEDGAVGGSGGGGSGGNGTPYGFGGNGISGQGNRGGNGITYNAYGGGGGGGAGAAGQRANNLSTSLRNGGDGGIGVANSISGTLKYYGGGGGGGALNIAKGGLGGLGGGGNARYSGAANTGGGGGGAAGSYNVGGGRGGSGVVIVRYSTSSGVMVYHEPTIVQQGSYALKIVADQTVSLNKTAVKTFPTPLNLSDNTYLSFYMRSNRTGSNVSVGIKDSGGTVTQITPNITVVNGYQKFTLDLSGVSNVNKDAINQLIITILNADLTNTLYIDNVVSGYDIPASLNDTVRKQALLTSRDMRDYDLITFWLRSTQAGAIIQFQFGEANVNENKYNFTIPVDKKDTWIRVPIDITGINNVNLDKISLFAFQILNLNPGESFYFDDIRNENLSSLGDIDYGEVIDGVYINGGLQSLSSTSDPSIQVLRYLRLEERLKVPVLVVDYHSKYGILAEQFFGNTYTLQKTEVGFKP